MAPMMDNISDSESGYDGYDSNEEMGKGGFADLARNIPFRMQQVLLNWVFIVASIALILDFASLQHLVRAPRPDYFAELCNWFGILSCFCWFLGFVLLTHWLHSVGATRMGLVGCYLKLVASVFFNLQPLTGTMNDPLLGGPAGLWWSNFTGILLFHAGNIVSCFDFARNTPPGADTSRGWFFHGNLPVTGMWVFQLATWFLVACNFLACRWGGDGESVLPLTHPAVYVCQFAGSGLLLVGSVIYTVWCDGFRNIKHEALE